MRERKMKFKIAIALLCALLITCLTCAVFSSTLHDCTGEECDICALARLIYKLLCATVLPVAVSSCVQKAFSVRFGTVRIRWGDYTPVGLRVKLLN